MLILERIPTPLSPETNPDPVSVSELEEHMRLDGDLVSGAMAHAHAAAAEIEAYCDIALMDQTIIALSEPTPGPVLPLPVGPVEADAEVTVDMLEVDGSYTPVTGSWFLQAGLFPKLHFATTPGGRLRVTYKAGFTTPHGVPADLRMAICDLAARLYDFRASDKTPTFPAAAARICARYRRVKI